MRKLTTSSYPPALVEAERQRRTQHGWSKAQIAKVGGGAEGQGKARMVKATLLEPQFRVKIRNLMVTIRLSYDHPDDRGRASQPCATFAPQPALVCGAVSRVGTPGITRTMKRTGDLNSLFLVRVANPGRPKQASNWKPAWPQSRHITQTPACNRTDSPQKGDGKRHKHLGDQCEKRDAGGRTAVSYRYHKFQAGDADAR